jgi:hypothetical protein
MPVMDVGISASATTVAETGIAPSVRDIRGKNG